MSYDDIKTTGQRMLNKYQLKKDFQWKEVDSLKKSYKKCLRPLFMKIDFSSEITDNPWLKSIEWLQSVFAKSQKLSDRPFSECPDKTIPKYLQDYLLENNTEDSKTINAGRYEYWMYRQINKQLTTGELYVENSINHRCFYHELVAIEQKEEALKKLNIPWLERSIEKQVDELTKKLNKLWIEFNDNLKRNKLKHLQYDDKKQKLRQKKVKASNNERQQKKFYKQFPFRDISDVLHFVDNSCNFLSAFTPLQPRHSKQELNKNSLVATILAQAFNYGNYKMSQTSDISYRSLETISQQYLRLETLKAANDKISNAISNLTIFPHYSLDLALIYGSLDGQKYELDTPNIKARFSQKYLREGQGVSAYTMMANHVPLQCELIGAHEHESYYVFDIWYNNTSDIIPDVLTGDMHSINKANFAILYCFGVQLQPRFTSFNDQLKNLYCSNSLGNYSNYVIKPVAQINTKIIIEQKNSMDQLVATLGLKEITQANLIKKLCHLPPETALRKAVFELDKLVRSIYTLEYMMDPQLQKTVHKSQNRLESYHQLRAAIAKIGGKKELYGKTDIDVEISNECNRLVANAIIYYNSVILSAILEKYGDSTNKKILAKLKKISPVAWHYHIHFSGQYTFQNASQVIDINEMLKNITLNI
jgi:TnpA family transposase